MIVDVITLKYMTLIIADIEDRQIHIESDTLMTNDAQHSNASVLKSLEYRLQPKVRILNDGAHAVAFAGLASCFYNVIKQIQNATSTSKISTVLLNAHRSCTDNGDYMTDFILACATTLELYRFHGGECTQINQLCHIGDSEAFNVLQFEKEKFVGTYSSTPDSRQDKITNEFRGILETDSYPSVGGILLGVKSHNGVFSYKQRQYSTFHLSDSPSEWFDDIQNSTTDIVSVVPCDGFKFHVSFPESKACFKFVEAEDGSMKPERIGKTA